MISRRELVLLLSLLLVYSYFIQITGPDALQRLDVILAVGRDGTFSVDNYHTHTPGGVFVDGHFYSDKVPGIAFFGAPVYLAVNALQGLDRYSWDNYPMLQYMTHLMTVFTIAVPAALLALLFLRFLNRLRPPRDGRDHGNVLVTLILAVATPFLPYATMFFTHDLTAALRFAAFYLLYLVKLREQPPRVLALAGLVLGIGVVVELPTLIFAGLAFVYLVAVVPDRRQVWWYVAGMLPGLLFLGVYNYAIFGSPFAVGYAQPTSPTGQFHQQGILGASLPNLRTAWELTFGWKGLFVYSPVLLLAPVGLWQMVRDKKWRAEGVLFAATVLIVFLLNAGHFSPFGDLAVGPRYLIPVFPFLVAPMALLWPRWRVPMIVLGMVSFCLMLGVTVLSPYVRGETANPWLQFWLPQIQRQYIVVTMPYVRYGMRHALSISLLPLVLGTTVLAWLAAPRLRASAPALYGRMANLFIIGLAAAYLLLAFPIDLRHPTQVPRYFQPPPSVQEQR